MLCDRGGLILSTISIFALLDDMLMSELKLEFESRLSFAIAESATSDLHKLEWYWNGKY